MDNCLDGFGWPEACTELTVLTDEEINACVQRPLVDEKVEGECEGQKFILCGAQLTVWSISTDLPDLPGCNPLQYGPEPATTVGGCAAVSTTIAHATRTSLPEVSFTAA